MILLYSCAGLISLTTERKQALWGTLAAGQEKEGELAATYVSGI